MANKICGTHALVPSPTPAKVEQQEQNKSKKLTKNAIRRVNMERSTVGTKKNILTTHLCLEPVLPKAVDELPNNPHLHLQSIHYPLGGV